jgi:APA family basic amino acid/polyamine antiporter
LKRFFDSSSEDLVIHSIIKIGFFVLDIQFLSLQVVSLLQRLKGADMQTLRKDLGLFSAFSIVVGIVIGSGVFVKPAIVLMNAHSAEMSLLAWLVGGLITLASGLTVAEVAARIPKTGGVFAYVKEIYGDRLSFTTAWIFTLIYGPGLSSALSLYFASLVTGFFTLSATYILPVALVTLAFLAIVNILGTKYGGLVQRVSTVIKFVPILMIGIFGLIYGDANQNILASFGSSTESLTAAGFGLAVLATLWAYDGWILVGNVAGELKDASRNLPRAIVGGLLVVIVAYLVVNIAIFALLPLDAIKQNSSNVSLFAAETLFGVTGGKIVSLGIIVSIFGCLNGSILSSPRIPYAVAATDKYPALRFLTRLHPTAATPINAILLQVGIAIVMILLANPDTLTDLALFSVYGFYVLVMIGLFSLRKKQGLFAGYKTPLFPVVPLIAIVGTMYILGSVIFEKPLMSALSISVCAVGYFVYPWMLKATTKAQEALR